MRRIAMIAAGIVMVGLVLSLGFVLGTGSDDQAVAQEDGQWSAVVASYLCEACSSDTGDPTLEGSSQQGDPNGSMRYAVNIIAKLDQDGCEWQWQLVDGDVVILYKC